MVNCNIIEGFNNCKTVYKGDESSSPRKRESAGNGVRVGAVLRGGDSPAATAPPKLARRIRDHDGVPLLERDEDLLSVGPTLD
ncbi:hypothetical protein [Oryza sativa Japonica Group]|uniref:Uncharacterized protein n=1 Tax=Oryza sativa subsp. japonica TaxID=39947 RepID=Q5NBS0_ORYSJ|nr:hypothetical protein [Oryza sativa Japonica Group]